MSRVFDVHNQRDIPIELTGADNEAVQAQLSAGAAGVTGRVVMSDISVASA